MTEEKATMNLRITKETEKKGLAAADVILVGVLLAAGAVLKFFVGSMFAGGMKPNFIIAMYCLAIMLIRPGLKEAAIIGLLAGAICQFFPGTPYINFASELLGAVVMAGFVSLMPKGGNLLLIPAFSTLFSTLASGFSFIGILYLIFFAGANVKHPPVMIIFLGIIAGTAIINAVIVQLLYIPLKLALKK